MRAYLMLAVWLCGCGAPVAARPAPVTTEPADVEPPVETTRSMVCSLAATEERVRSFPSYLDAYQALTRHSDGESIVPEPATTERDARAAMCDACPRPSLFIAGVTDEVAEAYVVWERDERVFVAGTVASWMGGRCPMQADVAIVDRWGDEGFAVRVAEGELSEVDDCAVEDDGVEYCSVGCFYTRHAHALVIGLGGANHETVLRYQATIVDDEVSGHIGGHETELDIDSGMREVAGCGERVQLDRRVPFRPELSTSTAQQ